MIEVDGIKFYDSGNGYMRNTKLKISLHRYLWEREYGKIPDGYVVHHINGDKKDNRIENLECIADISHRRKHTCKGFVKLSDVLKRQAKELWIIGKNKKEIAEKLNIGYSTVFDIVTKRTIHKRKKSIDKKE